MTLQNIGIQLYTLRRPFAEDPFGTLDQIRKIGYSSVEFAAPLDLDFDAFGKHLREIGLDCPSAHVGLSEIKTRPDDVLAMAKALGSTYLVLPYVLPDDRDWPRVTDALSRFADTVKGEGITVCYHHHDFEFETADGERPFDRLVADTDPEKVFFELDLYWLKKAGEDPLETINSLNGRVRLLHLKDWLPDGNMTDVGSGDLDFRALIAAGRSAGADHMFVEHDFPPKPYWPSVENSLSYLQGLGSSL